MSSSPPPHAHSVAGEVSPNDELKIHLQGQVKVRRTTNTPIKAPDFGNNVSMRWGLRYFLITNDQLIQQPTENASPSTRTFLPLSTCSIRWPNSQETTKGFSLSNSLRRLVLGESAVELAQRELDSTANRSEGSSSRFILEFQEHQLMFECESLQEAGRWFEQLEDRIFLSKRRSSMTGMELEPLVLVKHQFSKSIEEVYDLGSTVVPLLGSGMSGVVKRITRKSDGKKFAMKTILTDKLSLKQMQNLKNEVEILKILDHPHICKLYETFTEPGVCVRLVLELCEGGELFDRLHAKKRFSEAWVAKLVFRMVGVLRYLHENHIAHRDLKLENWLFRSESDNDEIVLIDFGLSYKYSPKEHMRKKVGTSYYVAPEVLKGDYMGVQADMWSLGVIVYMLLGGSAPFDGKDDDEILKTVSLGKRPNYETGAWRKISDQAKHFVQGLLTVDPNKRTTAEMALTHPWLISQELDNYHEFDQDMYLNLLKFAQFSTLKRIAMEVVAFSLDHEEIKQLTDVFQSMDSDHNGYVTFGGLKRELVKQFKISDEDLQRVFDALDEDHSGRVHVNEFVAATMAYKYHLDEKHLSQAFAVMDEDNSGFITVHNLKAILGKNIVNEARAKEMLECAERELNKSADSNKGLSFEEFLRFIRKDGEEKVDQVVRKSLVASGTRFIDEEDEEEEVNEVVDEEGSML